MGNQKWLELFALSDEMSQQIQVMSGTAILRLLNTGFLIGRFLALEDSGFAEKLSFLIFPQEF